MLPTLVLDNNIIKDGLQNNKIHLFNKFKNFNVIRVLYFLISKLHRMSQKSLIWVFNLFPKSKVTCVEGKNHHEHKMH